MTGDELRAPAIFAWLFFAPGVLFVIVDIVRLQVSGLFLLGVAFLAIWFWLIGGFTREFWVTDIGPDHPDSLGSLDSWDRQQDEAERAEWRAASTYFDTSHS